MRVKLPQETLVKSLSTVARFVSPKPSLPVLGNILLSVEEGKLKLSATNLQMGINFWLPAKIQEEGEITVPAKILLEFVSSLPPQEISLALEDKILHLSCGSFEANINGIDPEEFPSLVKIEGEPTLTLSASDFASSLTPVCFAASLEEGRPVLTGVLTEIEKEKISFVATDGYRLSWKKMEIDNSSLKKKIELLVPAKVLEEIIRIIHETKEEKVKIFVLEKQNQIVFSFEKIQVSSRLIEGSFPDYQKVIPKESKTEVEVEVEELTQAVKVASIFARNSANIIKISCDPKVGLQLSANTKEVGDNVSKVEAKIKGEPLEIAFNSRFVLDLLNNISSEMLLLEFSGNLAPGVFRLLSKKGVDKSFLHLIMPVRVGE